MKFPRCGFFLVLLLAVAPGRVVAEEPATLLEQAFRYDEGKATPRDAARAAALYGEAAAAGDAFAHLRLGFLCETGDGVPQDYAAARAHYQVAADAGLPDARVRLAICHLQGWGGPVDRPAFAREIRLAAEAGDAGAQRIYSQVCFAGMGIPADPAAGLAWLERAAQQEDAAAQYALGRVAEHSPENVMRKEMSLARTWYSLSADREYLTAMRAIARTLLSGSAADRDWVVAHRWLELAADAGDDEAPYILAIVEIMHVDSPLHDEAKARAWLVTASERGNERAKEVLRFAKAGRSLADAMRYVHNTPQADRYREYVAAGKVDGARSSEIQIVRAVPPTYPTALLLSRVSGTVKIRFTIDREGKVRNPQVLESPHPLLSERALAALELWQFHPRMKAGVPVETQVVMPFLFDPSTDERALGIDGILGSAAGKAQRLGTVPPADYIDLRLARPRGALAAPVIAGGAVIPADYRVVLLLVLDENGRPLRSYVLEGREAGLDEAFRQAMQQQAFEPRLIEGKAIPSNVVLAYLNGKYFTGH
jgi:TonB family protein